MNMNVQSRIFMLIGQIRDARRSILVSALIAAVVGIFIFLCGSYLLLFSYYEELHRIYYRALLQDIGSFQNRLIGRATYRNDMREIAGVLRRHRGVQHVWFTDRYGKLIYHTDSAVLGEYRGKRMPSEYYESIEHVWDFEEGYPVMHTVTVNWMTLRVSLPLYVAGHEEHDFVMGMDVRRFLLIPRDPRLFALFSGVYFFVALAILFLPTLLWLRVKLKRAEENARMMAGSIDMAVKQPVPETSRSRERGAASAGADMEDLAGQPPAPESAPAVQIEEPKPVRQPSDEILQEQRLIAFLKEKRSLFTDKSLSLGFVQAHGYVLHSKGVEGSYLFYHTAGGSHLYACYSAPKIDPPGVYETVTDTAATLRRALKRGVAARDLLQACNDLCRKKSLSFDLSVLLISEEEGSVEYCVSGTGTALYLKSGEQALKELKLENPGLGTRTKDKFLREISSAEIKLSKDELFCLVPHDAQAFMFDDRSLDSLLRELLVRERGRTPSEIAESVVRRFDSLDLEKKNLLPEMGFVIVKFQ
jgi:hypothetical protein